MARLLIIAAITAVATVSVVSGLKHGIRGLSSFNIGLAGLILLFVLVTEPTIYLLDTFVSSLGVYLQKLPATSFYLKPGAEGDWHSDWTLFYWSWWVSWSPFVGVFVARISKGRTLREFVVATLLVPSLAGFAWFAFVGGAGLFEEINHGTLAAVATDDTQGNSLFALLRTLPLADVTTVLAVVLVIVFFVTSSDSGSFVDDMVTSGGHPNPPRAQRVFWAVSEGAVAATLLAAGGLHALRSASLATGLPMTLVLVAALWGLYRSLRKEKRPRGRR